MSKMMTKAIALTAGATVFAGMLVSGIGAPARQAEAKVDVSGITNIMNPTFDNGTNVQIFKTDYGYGAWATDSHGNIIGNEPIAKTPYYIANPYLNAKKDSDYGDFVAAVEVTVNDLTPAWGFGGGVTTQTYYSEGDFAQNITDHFDHYTNAIGLWPNEFTAAASFDATGGAFTPYVFGFEFGDYNPNYVEFGTTTYNINGKYFDNTEVGVFTNTGYPDFSTWLDLTNPVPEVYPNPVFEDQISLIDNPLIKDAEGILANTYVYPDGDVETYPGQVWPDNYGDLWWLPMYNGIE